MNLLKTFFLIFFTTLCFHAYAQKSVKAKGEYKMKVENSIAWDNAKTTAILQAQINAIENTYGRVLSQENTSYIQNTQDGQSAQTNSTFNFISNSYVKGEWIEDLEEPKIEKFTEGNETWIKATVIGRVREITAPESQFDVATISCPELKCKTEKFNDGQDFYVYFKSPENGNVSIYLTDPSINYTFLLLPYKNSKVNRKSVPVLADKEYFFFSKKFDYYGDNNAIDEQEISVSNNATFQKYQLWIVFSPESLDKPVLEDETITTMKFLDQESIKKGYTLQKGIADDKFKEWLQKYRVINKKVQLSSLFIDVAKM